MCSEDRVLVYLVLVKWRSLMHPFSLMGNSNCCIYLIIRFTQLPRWETQWCSTLFYPHPKVLFVWRGRCDVLIRTTCVALVTNVNYPIWMLSIEVVSFFYEPQLFFKKAKTFICQNLIRNILHMILIAVINFQDLFRI